ncbi:MAG TPA: hypothetical protein VGP24_16530 [Glaciihabitans sp.]|jgi:hypothetical protein|nr:hypothetical protein [Glaciihabitans sp.]
MIFVICPDSELAEDGIVIRVNDNVKRVATPFANNYYGDALDDVDWLFDQYAAGSPSPPTMILSGRVVEIQAIYVRLTNESGKGWEPIRGQSRLQSLSSTADTPRPEPRIAWASTSPPTEDGTSYSRGYDEIRSGDERFNGWLISLEETTLAPVIFQR